MSQNIQVITFPKRCPHCNSVLVKTEPRLRTYVECRNDSCPNFLTGNTIGKYRYQYGTKITGGDSA